jgi:hypothetical protein
MLTGRFATVSIVTLVVIFLSMVVARYQQRLFYFVRGAFIASNNPASYILHSFHAE